VTDQDLQHWLALSEKASPGPWGADLERQGRVCDGKCGDPIPESPGYGPASHHVHCSTIATDMDDHVPTTQAFANAEFIAAARTVVPALIAAVKSQRTGADASGIDITFRLRGFLGGSGTAMTPLATVPSSLDLWRLLRDAADEIDQLNASIATLRNRDYDASKALAHEAFLAGHARPVANDVVNGAFDRWWTAQLPRRGNP
jgi:hypothetical protein